MPANKNALIRYRYLDELLSSRVKYYTRQELTDKLNEHLSKSVSKRFVEKDLIDIQDEWGIEYDEKIYDGKKYIHYADPITHEVFYHCKPERVKGKNVLIIGGVCTHEQHYASIARLVLEQGAEKVEGLYVAKTVN